MSYAIKQDMISRYGLDNLVELTDRADPATGSIGDQILQAALDAADALINSYIGKRYQVPLAETPAVLRPHAEVIAYYTLHRGHYPEQLRTEYEDSIGYLKQVSRGEAVLDVAGNQPTSAPAEAIVVGPDRMFNRNSLKGL